MKANDSRAPAARRHLRRALRSKALILAGVAVLFGVVAAAALAATTATADTGTVKGIVVLGPMIPVDPGSPIVWVPQKAAVSVVKNGGTALMVTPSDANGHFTLSLAPGRYRLTARALDGTTVSRAVTLTVKSGGSYRVRLWIDTGVHFPTNATAKPTGRPGGQPLSYDQGLVGVTVLGPLKPVSKPGEVNQKPYAASLRVWHEDGRLAATVRSSARSGFVVALPVGRYIVEPLGRPALYPRAAPFSITVKSDSWQRLTILYDTGIR
jgi:hypothetical protein